MSRRRQQVIFPGTEQDESEISPNTSLAATFRHFERHLRVSGKTAHTVTSFLSDLKNLEGWKGGDIKIKFFTKSRLMDYLDWMEYERGVPCSRKTFARRVTTLKVFFAWLVEIGGLRFDPALELAQRSGEAPLSRVLSKSQIADCKRAAAEIGPRPELIFHIILHTGLKIGELQRVRLDDITRFGDSFVIHVLPRRANPYTKRSLNIHQPDTIRILSGYGQAFDPKDKLFEVSGRRLQKDVQRIGKVANLRFGLAPEILRWTFAVHQKLSGVPGETIRKRLGISPTHWIEVGRKITRIIAEHPSIVK